MNNWMNAYELSKEQRRQAEASAEREQIARTYTVHHIGMRRVLTLIQQGSLNLTEQLRLRRRPAHAPDAQLRMRKA